MFSNRNAWNKYFIENVVLTGISSSSLLQVFLQTFACPAALLLLLLCVLCDRISWLTSVHSSSSTPAISAVTHCSCQNNPENIQKRVFWYFQRLILCRVRHLCSGSIIVTKQTPLFPLGNQEVTSDVILLITTGRRHILLIFIWSLDTCVRYCIYKVYNIIHMAFCFQH